MNLWKKVLLKQESGSKTFSYWIEEQAAKEGCIVSLEGEPGRWKVIKAWHKPALTSTELMQQSRPWKRISPYSNTVC